MTIGPLDHVYYWTTDLDRAVKFYQDVLGLEVAFREGSSGAEVDPVPPRLSLHGAVEGRPIETGGAAAAFRVDDLDEARLALEARGVEFDHQGEVEGYGRFALFRDPDGNIVSLVERSPGRSG
jgi:catechol 2,3-dioxygenase-like lactoylglutathione lyase family enzyme